MFVVYIEFRNAYNFQIHEWNNLPSDAFQKGLYCIYDFENGFKLQKVGQFIIWIFGWQIYQQTVQDFSVFCGKVLPTDV